RSTVEEWDIARVTALVHDNAANALNAAELTEWPHFGCVAHTLQLAIKSGLDLPIISRLTAISQNLVGHFKHSVPAMTALKGKQAQLGIQEHHLLQDVTTRWNLTYFLMEHLYLRYSKLNFLMEREAMSSKDELEYFSKEPVLDHNSDPLEWWRKNEERFPTLSKLARKLFCVVATSVPSERVFSVAGNIITKN
uniref:HAT C-terminal dimerisation domain-containing protein n=1 Tax=Amphimedon queenslandica TaxID=400682 RepID=A0A1X7VLU2_AMPQE